MCLSCIVWFRLSVIGAWSCAEFLMRRFSRIMLSHYFTVLPALLVLCWWKWSMLFCKRLLVCWHVYLSVERACTKQRCEFPKNEHACSNILLSKMHGPDLFNQVKVFVWRPDDDFEGIDFVWRPDDDFEGIDRLRTITVIMYVWRTNVLWWFAKSSCNAKYYEGWLYCVIYIKKEHLNRSKAANKTHSVCLKNREMAIQLFLKFYTPGS
jgi:hypothetical protein